MHFIIRIFLSAIRRHPIRTLQRSFFEMGKNRWRAPVTDNRCKHYEVNFNITQTNQGRKEIYDTTIFFLKQWLALLTIWILMNNTDIAFP